jgi:enediyne biosynthesis protein E4
LAKTRSASNLDRDPSSAEIRDWFQLRTPYRQEHAGDIGDDMTNGSFKGLAFLVVGLAFLIVLAMRFSAPPAAATAAPDPALPSSATSATASTPSPGLEAEAIKVFDQQRKKFDDEVWAKEVAAQKHEMAIIALWDELRATKDRVAVLGRFPVGRLTLGQMGPGEELEDGVSLSRCSRGDQALDQDAWRVWLASLVEQGYRLEQMEFHHSRFDAEATPSPRSLMSMTLGLVNDKLDRRITVKGNLDIAWGKNPDADGRFHPESIDASDMTVLTRTGATPFVELAAFDRRKFGRFMVYDLDGDGFSEIVLLYANQVLRNRGDGTFRVEPLCAQLGKDPTNGLLGDFTGDGAADLMCSELHETPSLGWYLVLYPGNADGTFTTAGRAITGPDNDYNNPAFTAGDVDGDGDLDLFLSRYKLPYFAGQMPTPYFDANDGFAAHLLINQGNADFSDGTEAAGLMAKRYRRTYSASLVDLDDDHDLDLLVVSDFSGVDAYANDGKGHFTDVTAQAFPERSLFGMSHCLGDFNGDGKPDIYVTGMSSTTARRLQAMKLGRADFPQHDQMRPKMAYGNRMFLANQGLTFTEPAFKDEVARSGWSWGCSAIDVENDGDPDLYIANGMISSGSAQDYCTTYWCHDIYTGTSKPDPRLDAGLKKSLSMLNKNVSWNGFEKNVLFLNLRGQRFVSVGFLMGVADERDCRAVIGDDIDGDGKIDLIVEEDASKSFTIASMGEETNGYLRILKNAMPTTNHWIGVRLREQGPGYSPFGAVVTVAAGNITRSVKLVSGDSFYSQHANNAHIGLGASDSVDWLEVRWPNGKTKRVEHPQADRWHAIAPER